MIRCPVCSKWFNNIDNVNMERHLEKKHNIMININKMSFEVIDGKIETYNRKKGKG